MTAREDFLSRWARRKAEAKTGVHPQTDDVPAPASGARAAAVPAAQGVPEASAEAREPDMLRDDPPDEETRAAWIEKLEAVDLEALNYKDDFTVFMRGWVPQALRNRALKRLWGTSDVFAVLDGLAEYDEDYTDAATIVGEIKTNWKPGRGYAEDEAVAEVEDEADADEAVEVTADEPEAGSDDAPADDEGAAAEPEDGAAPAKSRGDDDVG